MGSTGGTLTRGQLLKRAGAGGVALASGLVGVRTGLAALDLARASAAPGPTPVLASLRSRALAGELKFAVYLPTGYFRAARRYPVVYFLHGLPANPGSYLGLGWVAQALASSGGEAILVVPQGTRVVNGDPEYHDWGPGANWATALAEDLPDWIDDRYRTVAHRNGRAIVGLSAGGYGASIIGLHRPATYAAIQSWSGYFHPTDPSGTRTRSVGTPADNDDADVEALVPHLRSQFRTHPTSFAFYVGSSDPTFVPANRSLQQRLTAARVEHVFRLYPGGHSQTLWQAHAGAWLRLALDALERA